jgi:cytoskeletal protein RodZ
VYDPQALGQRLRDARVARDLTIEDVERAIRIRARFLDALEQGDYAPMTPVQVQGFLRNYARYLGLDFDLLVAELDSEGKGRGRRRPPEPPPARRDTPPPAVAIRPAARPASPVARPPKPRARRGLLANIAIVLVAGAIVIVLVLGITQLLDRLVTSEENNPVTQLLPTPTPAPTDTFAPGETPVEPPAASYVPPTLTGNSVVVSIQLAQRTWLRVTVDGVIAQEGLARPGDVWRFEGKQSVGVRASSAAALQLTVNNVPQGVVGGRGELFDQTFTLSGGVSLAPTAATTATLVLEPGDLTPAQVPAAATASPEPATPSITPWPTLSDGAPTVVTEEKIPVQPVSPIPTTAAPAAVGPTFTAAVPTTAVSPVFTSTPAPPPTNTTARTPTPTPSLSPTRTPTLTFTPSLTPSLTLTPTPTATTSPTATLTPSLTPFLPPRITRTPSPPPK